MCTAVFVVVDALESSLLFGLGGYDETQLGGTAALLLARNTAAKCEI